MSMIPGGAAGVSSPQAQQERPSHSHPQPAMPAISPQSSPLSPPSQQPAGSISAAMASALQHPQQPQGSQLQPPARLPQPQPHHLLGNASTGMAMGVGVGVFPQLSASTEEILKRMQAQCGGVPGAGGWEAAREHVLQQMVTTQNMSMPTASSQQHASPSATTGRGSGTRSSGRARGAAAAAAGDKADRAPRKGSAAVAGGAASSGTPSGTGRGRGGWRGRGRGGRRKRTKREEEDEDEGDGDESSDHSSASETLSSLPTKTKSGRRVHRPTHFDPAMKTPTRRRGPYRRNAEASVCRICQRAPSPRSNPIVICDGCNGLYHQYCHDPPIEDEVIRVEENEWLCADCMGVRADANMAADGVASSGISEADLQRAMSGEELTVEEKRAYFVRLPQASLVSLLLHATSVHPNLPVFAADVKQIISQPLPAPRPRGLSVVQGLQTDGLPRATAVGGQGMPSSNAQQQPFSQGPGVASAPPAPYQPFKYPKPGNGIRLPPVEYVEDEDEVAFSHLVRDPQTRRLEKASQLQPALLPPPPPPQQPPKAQAERHGSLGGDSMGMDGAMDMARRMSTSTQQPQPLPRPQQPERENGVGLLASAGIATIGTGTASAATGIASADPSRPGTSTGRGEMVDVSGGAGAGSKAMSGVVGA